MVEKQPQVHKTTAPDLKQRNETLKAEKQPQNVAANHVKTHQPAEAEGKKTPQTHRPSQ